MQDTSKRAFLKHGKGLFDADLLTRLRERFIALEKSQASTDVTEREKNALQRGESTDKLRMQSAWYDVWRNPVSHSDLVAAIAPYRYVTFPVQVRHVRQAHHHVPWHQDIGYMRLLGDRGPKQVITCFIPLEPNPAKCTTIQFALDNIHEAPEKEYKHDSLDGFGAGISQSDFKDLLHYDLALGDALIFGDFTLHRTYLPEGCQVDRRSLEFRLVKPEHIMPGKDYFDVHTRTFVKVADNLELAVSDVA